VSEVPQSGSYIPTERSPRSRCTGVGEKQIIASDKNRSRSYSPVTILTENCAQGNTANVYNTVEFRFQRKIPECNVITLSEKQSIVSLAVVPTHTTQPTIHRSGKVAAVSHKRHSLYKTRVSHILRKTTGNCCIDPIMCLRNNRCQDTHKRQVLWARIRARGLLRNPASPMSPVSSSSSFILIATKHASTLERSWVSARSEVYSDVVNNRNRSSWHRLYGVNYTWPPPPTHARPIYNRTACYSNISYSKTFTSSTSLSVLHIRAQCCANSGRTSAIWPAKNT